MCVCGAKGKKSSQNKDPKKYEWNLKEEISTFLLWQNINVISPSIHPLIHMQ